MNIVFGDRMTLGGFRYALLLINMNNHYSQIYGIKATNSQDVINDLEELRGDNRGLPKRFHSNFERKLIGGVILQ